MKSSLLPLTLVGWCTALMSSGKLTPRNPFLLVIYHISLATNDENGNIVEFT